MLGFDPKVTALANARLSLSGLYRSGTLGAFFDIQPWTVFADAAHTTLAAPGTGVASVADISGQGRHAVQASAGLRPTFGLVPVGGRRNLLGYTRSLSTGWGKNAGVSVASGASDPEGGADAVRISTAGGGSPYPTVSWDVDLGAGTYGLGVTFHAGTAPAFILGIVGTDVGASGQTNLYRNFNASTEVLTNIGGTTGALLSETVTDLTGGWRRWTVTFAASTVTEVQFRPNWNDNAAVYCDVFEPQFEVSGNSAPQVVGSPYDVSEAGVRSLHYLGFDMVDDVLKFPIPDLGTDATIFRANWGSNTINTGQTVTAGNRDIPPDAMVFAYGILDRAMTAAEAEARDTYLDFKRGAA